MQLLQGRLLFFKDNPALVGSKESVVSLPQGAIAISEDGKILAVGEAKEILAAYPHAPVETYDENHLLMPGFIDPHLHFPQTEMIGAYGKQLLDWLAEYTFPTEQKFEDPVYAQEMAKIFLKELLRHGVTTAVAYGSSSPTSVEALFTVAAQKNFSLIAGKVHMSRNAPETLLRSPQQSYDESLALIEKWHEKGRLRYALTPRFAITCPPEELELVGALMHKAPRLYLQTHLSENHDEVTFTQKLFPQHKNYTDIYDAYGLLGSRSLFGHAIHLQTEELQRLADTQSVLVHCPTSNLFLGSGLFSWDKVYAVDPQMSIGIASDVGAGTSFSPLKTLGAAYQIAQLQGYALDAFQSFYHLTLGNARALSLDHTLGTFAVGYDADIVVLRTTGESFMQFRQGFAHNLHDELFLQMILGDDRSIAATYLLGKKQPR